MRKILFITQLSTDIKLFINTLEKASQQQYIFDRNEDASLVHIPNIVTLNDIFHRVYFLVLAFDNLRTEREIFIYVLHVKYFM